MPCKYMTSIAIHRQNSMARRERVLGERAATPFSSPAEEMHRRSLCAGQRQGEQGTAEEALWLEKVDTSVIQVQKHRWRAL